MIKTEIARCFLSPLKQWIPSFSNRARENFTTRSEIKSPSPILAKGDRWVHRL